MKNKEIYDQFSDLIFSSEDHGENLFKNNTNKNLSAYRHNYLFGLIGVLENFYVSTKLFLEEDNFKFFCKEYIEATPSQSPNLDDYGKGFSTFLESRSELSDVGFIKHLAALDWFWFSQGRVGATIELPSGILDFWGKITNQEELVDVSIDEDIIEEIEICIDDENNYFMKSKTK